MPIIVDNAATSAYLGTLNQAGVNRIIVKGLTAGAAVFKAAITVAAPVKGRASAGASGTFTIRHRSKGVTTYSQGAYGIPGELKASTRSARIHSNPGIGFVIGPMGKTAFARYWVNDGTKPHSIPITIRGHIEVIPHPGAHPNPYVARGGEAAQGAAVAIAQTIMLAEAAKL